MRPLLTSLAATLALASPALARTAAEADRLPVLPTAAGYAPATGLSFDGTPEVTRKGGSIFSARGDEKLDGRRPAPRTTNSLYL